LAAGTASARQAATLAEFYRVRSPETVARESYRGSRPLPTGVERPQGDPSDGFPNSVTQHGKLVYVLNSGGQGSITGFRLSSQGILTPIPGATRALNANQISVRPDTLFNPTQVSFTPDSKQLVVTIKDAADSVFPGIVATGPGRVLVFDVDRAGLPSSPSSKPT
jgi:hypothetical protein